VDTWLAHSEVIEDGLISIEEDILNQSRMESLDEIHQWKKHVAWLRWMFRPYRDLKSWLVYEASDWFSESVKPYLSDVSDHAVRVLDTLDLYRETVEDLLTIHMTVLSNRLNSVMKVLTVISTIFIPLTFLAGVYGMNFKYMPELNWHWGYPIVIGAMVLIALSMLVFFIRKKWL
jgi:magnesium transporter